MNNGTITVFYFTCASTESAQELCSILIEKSLIACANIIDSLSIFSWNNRIEKSNEVTVIAKTTNQCAITIEKLIQSNHNYQVPCILYFNVNANPEYKEYIEKLVKN